jgi:hypothetical protein
MQGNSVGGKASATSISTRNFPNLLSRLQQCSGLEKENAFAIIKRLALAAESVFNSPSVFCPLFLPP